MSRRIVSAAAAVAVALGLLLAGAPSAQAATATARLKPTYARVNTRSAEKFTYSSSHVSSSAHAYLQRLSGKSWKTVVSLGRHRSGSASLVVSGSGSLKFRVIFKVGSTRVATSKTVKVSVIPASKVVLRGVTTRVSTGQSAKFTYTATNLPSDAKVILQRQYGTAKTWKAVKKLSASPSASVTAPALTTLGRYAYRVAIVRGTSTLKASTQVAAYAYAQVSLVPGCGYSDCGESVEVGDRVFTATDFAKATIYPTYWQHSVASSTTCRSLTVQFAGNEAAQESSAAITYLRFVQSNSDPVYAQVESGKVGTVVVKLDGGPLSIDAASTDTGLESPYVDMRITGSCWSPAGNLEYLD